jgi:hypothetical protein
MKPKKVKKLRLVKETIRNLDIVLERDEQKQAKGGTGQGGNGTTQVPVYC